MSEMMMETSSLNLNLPSITTTTTTNYCSNTNNTNNSSSLLIKPIITINNRSITSTSLSNSIDQSSIDNSNSHVESSPLSSVSFNSSFDNFLIGGIRRGSHFKTKHRDSDASSNFGNISNSLHTHAGIDFLQISIQYKLENSLYDPFNQTTIHNELYEIIENINQTLFIDQFKNNNNNSSKKSNEKQPKNTSSVTTETSTSSNCSNSSKKADAGEPPNCHYLKEENYFLLRDYSSIVFNNNHLIWNIKNLTSFVSSSPLFQCNAYFENINQFRDDLHLIHRFYKILLNDLIFQLCFIPETNSNIKPPTSRKSYGQISLFQYNKLSISTIIKIITELKLQFEYLETNFTKLRQRSESNSFSNLNNSTNSFNNSNSNNNSNIRLMQIFSNLLSNSIFLNHYVPSEYLNYSVLQRFIYNALSNFTKRIRLKMIDDNLFQNLFNKERKEILFIWMIFCSNNSQQYYLNSCNPSAFNLSFIMKSPFLPSLLIVLKEILKKIEVYKNIGNKKTAKAYYALFDSNVPTIYEFMEKKISKITKIYNTIYQEAIEASEHNDTISFNQIIKLVSNWNLAMQSFSAIFSPSSPKILTKKPISNDWHASAYLMSVYCGLTFFLPNQPKLLDRVSGTPPYFFEAMMFINYDYCFPKLSRYYRSMYDDYAEKYKKMSPEDKRDSILRLWEDVFVMGGVLFCSSERILGMSVGHLNYLFSIKIDEQGYFLVGDPEIKYFKIFNFDQIEVIILGDVFNFAGAKAE